VFVSFPPGFVPHGRKPSPAHAAYMDVETVEVLANGEGTSVNQAKKSSTTLSRLFAWMF
jgi:hypothetical protein